MSRLNDEHTETKEPEQECCEHGYPEGRGCQECEYWERVDYEYARYWDK
jgi:hypothetical protein